MGVLVLFLAALALSAGLLRGELSLALTGAVFLALWVYCLLMTLLLALCYRSRARRASLRVSPRETAVKSRAAVMYGEGAASGVFGGGAAGDSAHNGALGGGAAGRFFALPGIVIRCRLLLATKDGRRIRHDFPPLVKGRRSRTPGGILPGETFPVEQRGAYFSDYDELAFFDALGFFRFAFRLPVENSPRLLASPGPAEEPLPARACAGESVRQPELTFQRTDDLIDHRPYVPGDDPRRINWKLYGHGGGLFVREGEREPPPHSNMLILVDGEYDPLLYSAEMARNGVDLLCENALAAALACAEFGVDARVGWSAEGAGGLSGAHTHTELAAALALPAALPLPAARTAPAKRGASAAAPLQAELPPPPEDRGIMVLALPRDSAEPSALDRFLKQFADTRAARNSPQTTELLFLYAAPAPASAAASGIAAAAETCAAMYNRRPGVRAWGIGVSI
jgi:uncharacterized protein (DUF58 family)